MLRTFLLLLCFLAPAWVQAQMLSEKDIVESLVRSLQTKDATLYSDLFPQTDSLINWTLHSTNKQSDLYKQMLYLQNNYAAKQDFDSAVHKKATDEFLEFVRKGNAEEIHWDRIVFVRYELEKIRQGRDFLSQQISSLRFLGYVFVKDMLNRKTYGFTIFDIMQVNGFWYGGELSNIFESSNKEEFENARSAEKKRAHDEALGIVDSNANAPKKYSFDDNDARRPKLKEIIERKFYKGKFDNEIPVQLYVRYIKGGCPEIACAWDALFKFGDQDDYVRMEVSRNSEGKWQFSEELGGMELKLDDKIYTGAYASNSDKTEYDVKLTETEISIKKIQALDEQLDKGMPDE
ncbi:MAG: hypothetical protein JSS78_00880 [Bacteroidetes bacterium]|nr:hypothetical protein [Bacteroidota bacterium]